MRTKAKAALIAGAAIVGVAGGIWFSWCSGINYERRYKKLFDKTFKGDYKITVTDSEFGTDDDAPLKIPSIMKDYDIEYKDKNGNERHLELNSGEGYLKWYQDESLSEYIRNRYTKSDGAMMTAFSLQIYNIVNDDIIDNVLPKYFEAERDHDSSHRVNGDGYTINISAFDYAAGYTQYRYRNNDKVSEYLSPENCPVLSDIDMDSAADIKTFVFRVNIDITDESKYDMIDEFTEKAEALCQEYAAASDFGGNYCCTVRTLSGEEKGFEEIDKNQIYVAGGEKVNFDPYDDKAYDKYKDMIVEKCGYNTSEK